MLKKISVVSLVNFIILFSSIPPIFPTYLVFIIKKGNKIQKINLFLHAYSDVLSLLTV